MELNGNLAREKVSKLLMSYSVPCIISLLVGALYNIVDQIFIANASYLGSYGNAANTVVFPLTVIALAVAVMIGDGCCTYVSINLGMNKKENVKLSIGNSIIITIFSSVVIMLTYLILSNQIITMFGGTVNNKTFEFAKEYFYYITIGIPFYMFGQAMNPIIRADGSPKFAMLSTVAGAITNLILDPVFIYIFRWGMMGAAVATVIGQIVTVILAIYYLRNMRIVKAEKKDFVLNMSIIKNIIILGATSFLSQISLVVAMAAVNNMIRKYSSQDQVFSLAQYAQIPMAVVGIVMKFFQIVISIVVGMAAGSIPVVGYNIGAKLYKRVKDIFILLLKAETIVGIISFIIVEVFPKFLINIFGATNESIYYTEFAIKSFRIYLCMIILACINKATFIFLQAMGKAKESMILSMVREIVFGVGFALLLPQYFGLDGVLYSMPLSDLLTFIIAVYLICKVMKEFNKNLLLNR